MAGDWIKMRTSLLTNPKVNGIARVLEDDRDVSSALSTGFSGPMSEIVTRNVMRHVTVSSLLVIWGAANEHTKDGVFVNADLSDIDDMVGIPGFGQAMELVGWAEFDVESNSVRLPNFNEYNTSGAVRSAGAKSAAERQKEYRERKKSDVAYNKSNDSDATRYNESDVTSDRREEKRREDIKEPPNPQGGAEPETEKPKRVRKDRIQLKTFIERCTAAGEKPISEYSALLTYCEETGLPMEFVSIAWDQFKREFLTGHNSSRLQADWRRHFLNYVTKGYYRLWYAKPGVGDSPPTFELSTTGLQAKAQFSRGSQ